MIDDNALEVIIDNEHHEQRLDKTLAILTGISRNHILDSIKAGKVLNTQGQIVQKHGLTVREGDVFTILPYEKQYQYTPESEYALNIVYEDEYLLIVDKIRGQVAHPSAGHTSNTLLDSATKYIRANNIPIHTFNGELSLINRLDRDTSGLMLLAKDDAVHNHIKQQFADRMVTKIYKAKVHHMEKMPEICYLDGYIGPHHNTEGLMECYEQKVYKTAPGRYADLQHLFKSKWQSNFLEMINKNQSIISTEPVEEYHFFNHKYNQTAFKYGLLECVRHEDYVLCLPHTGRQHQIRVQLLALGCPILGDKLYAYDKEDYMHLRSIFINFYHTKKQQMISIYCP